MTSQPLHIAVLIGSTRPGRRGPAVARWFVEHATTEDGPTLDLIDLADHQLPAVLGDTDGDTELVDDLTARLAKADGFVVITPEYNHSFPASLKQAIDWHKPEWVTKPVALVSYGGRGGGLRAAEQLRLVFAELHTMTVRDTVSLHGPWWEEDEDGNISDPSADAAIAALMDQLTWWAQALRRGREEAPYAHG